MTWILLTILIADASHLKILIPFEIIEKQYNWSNVFFFSVIICWVFYTYSTARIEYDVYVIIIKVLFITHMFYAN
jgi:hypothetical protein